MFALRFDQFAHALFSREDGERMRMSDLAIPFEAVVAGVRRQSFAALPSKFRRPELAALQLRSIPFHPIGIGPQVAARMWQVAAFIDSRVVKPIVISGAAGGQAANPLPGEERCLAVAGNRVARLSR